MVKTDTKEMHGEWTHRDVEENTTIEEWQAAKCSLCGRWLTTPYLYSFHHYNYCPNCGAAMAKDGKRNDGRTNRG